MDKDTHDICEEKQHTELNIENPEKEILEDILGKEINEEKLKKEIIEEKLVKPPDTCRNIRLYFREYCLNSSLHGIRYLGEKGRSKIERVWWFLFFITSIFMCSHLIRKTWNKWDSMPVIIGFAETPTFVWQIPFPAITICSKTKIRQRIYNFTNAYHKMYQENITEEEENTLSHASLICDRYLYTSGNDVTDQRAIDFIEEVAPDIEELLWVCKWIYNSTSCASMFSKSLTEEGLCYTFNMLDNTEVFNEEAQNEFYLDYGIRSDWSLDKGYIKGSTKYAYPSRTYGSKIGAGMTILLRAYKQDFDYTCRGPTQGFKVLFHNPEELPRTALHFNIEGSWRQEINIAIQPDIVTTSKELKNYHPSRRNCFFPNEKILRYFKIYTQSNCEVECLANYTLSKCGCVAFHMPRFKNTAICGSGSRECVSDAQNEYDLKELKDELEESYIDLEDITLAECNCLPGCTSLAYNAESSHNEFQYMKLFEGYSVQMDEYPGIQISRINIYFKDTQFLTWRRSELYDQTDFLANCGGLLGLFMGFSFLSLVEIAYFLTLRLCCNIQKNGRRMWNAVKIEKK